MRRFWFFWFFWFFQLYLHQLPYQQYPNIINKSLYHLYSFVPLFSSFSQYFTVPLFLLDSSHSSRIQWSPVEWNWIPVNSTGLQTEMEIELEFCSKHMCTNSCKYKYSIYTDFCGVSVISCTMRALWSTIQTDLGTYNQRLQLCLSIFRNWTCGQPPNNPWHQL